MFTVMEGKGHLLEFFFLPILSLWADVPWISKLKCSISACNNACYNFVWFDSCWRTTEMFLMGSLSVPNPYNPWLPKSFKYFWWFLATSITEMENFKSSLPSEKFLHVLKVQGLIQCLCPFILTWDKTFHLLSVSCRRAPRSLHISQFCILSPFQICFFYFSIWSCKF